MKSIARVLKRWRGNYYLSLMLASVTRPVYTLSAKAKLQIERKIRKNGVTIRLPNGKSMTIARDTGIGLASLLFWHGIDGYEPETSPTLRFFFERRSTFIDVGANCGLYSLLGVLWNLNLQVVAFEPVPQTFTGLKRNVHLNHLEDRVRCENVALSSRSGTATFFLPDNAEGGDIETTGTLAADSWQSRQNSPPIEVRTIRFDEYERQNHLRVDLVKIDVEDFEADVLEGMREVIQRDRPFIVCEILPRAHGNERTRAIVESLGYYAYWITSAGYIRAPVSTSNAATTPTSCSRVSTPETVLVNLAPRWALRDQVND